MQEVKELWDNGVKTFNATIKYISKMHATLMPTFSDFHELGNLFGYNMNTALACHTCNFNFKPQH